MQALLEVDSLVFAYPGAPAPVLDHASLHLLEGERLGLLGDNGCGKSTLLHLVAGLLKPASGRILIQGRVCATEKDFVIARRSLGYLLQHSEDQLFCPTVLEDVAFGPANTGASEAQAFSLARSMLARLDLARLADRNGSNLSGGEKKLAALATVLVMEPRFLLLDEPTNDLSATARSRLLEVLRGLPLPFIAISHDQDFLAQLCTRFCLLEQGLCRDATLSLSAPR